MSHPVLFLWGHSRSCSTAFFRMMLERGDFIGVHEPFSGLVAQGYTVVDGRRATSGSEVLDILEEMSHRTPVFVKEVTEFRYDVQDDPRLAQMGTHSFIVRDPAQTIASHYAMNPEVSCGEIGYEHEWNLHAELHAATRSPAPVVEAEQLLAAPEAVVRAYCGRTGIPFEAAALDWQPGHREEWERTARWHQDVARSSGFTARTRSYDVNVRNHPRLAAYHAHHLPYYERLRAHALTRPVAQSPASAPSAGSSSGSFTPTSSSPRSAAMTPA
jgi:hypothetical protein